MLDFYLILLVLKKKVNHIHNYKDKSDGKHIKYK